ncbi:MAG: Modification methylase VspI [Parcubacteria group bacterium ADurb.Bin326]|nr:MAG: Modification methylase VspI [Parcubacteria group bacterium ADurb.Bin326]
MNKKDLGAFYTPKHTVNYMVNLLFGFDEKSKLLEPCGGDGAFISDILENNSLKSRQITVWDINPDVKNHIERLGVKFELKDALLQTIFQNDDLFNKIEKFTHIIGNPPYLNKQSSYIKKNKNKLKKIYDEIGVNDTYALFIYLCCHLLETNGQLCFITSDTYLTLGIHKKLRKFLLTNFVIKNITLCQHDLFKDTGALVNTCIIFLENRKIDENDIIIFNDCRNLEIGNYNGDKYYTKQNKLLSYPDYIFDFNGNGKLIEKIEKAEKLIDFVDGGLGMHTTDNEKFLAIVDYNGIKYAKNGIKKFVSVDEVKNKDWKFYHKKGGDTKYYLPAEYCIRWDNESIKSYKMPKNYNLREKRQGFLISGICSTLSARMATVGALWESNKAMCFFPKNPQKYPPEFFIGILNSDPYNKIIKILNHTNSIQIRDIKKLPLFNFDNNDIEQIVKIVKKIIEQMKKNIDYNFSLEQNKINQIVNKYIL